VINQTINITRDDYDQLKENLHNCARHGPRDQNRVELAEFRAHLAGSVAHAVRLNPWRGEWLICLFERIAVRQEKLG